MNKYLKKVLIVSASALMFLSVGAGTNNVQARRYHYRYHRRVSHNKYGYWKHYRRHGRRHSYFVRYKTGYYHNGHWVRYHHKYGISSSSLNSNASSYPRRHGHSRFKVHFRRISPRHHGHSHFQVKFRKISGPSDDNTENTTPTAQYKSNKSTRHSKINTSAWRQAVASDELKLITEDRAQHNKAPLQEDPELDTLARMRAKQTYDSNAMFKSSNPHIDPATGQLFDNEDAQQLGYTNLVNTMGENLAGGVADNSPKETAKEDNDMLYTQEEPYDGGHYQNIIGEYDNSQKDENYLTVGVGAYGNVLAEDFSFGNSDGNNYETPFEQQRDIDNAMSSEGHWTGPNTYTFPNGMYDTFNTQRTHVTVHIPGQGIRQY